MFEHRGVEIEVQETLKFQKDGYTIESSGVGLFYVAVSKYGVSVDGFSPQAALNGARKQIDSALL